MPSRSSSISAGSARSSVRMTSSSSAAAAAKNSVHISEPVAAARSFRVGGASRGPRAGARRRRPRRPRARPRRGRAGGARPAPAAGGSARARRRWASALSARPFASTRPARCRTPAAHGRARRETTRRCSAIWSAGAPSLGEEPRGRAVAGLALGRGEVGVDGVANERVHEARAAARGAGSPRAPGRRGAGRVLLVESCQGGDGGQRGPRHRGSPPRGRRRGDLAKARSGARGPSARRPPPRSRRTALAPLGVGSLTLSVSRAPEERRRSSGLPPVASWQAAVNAVVGIRPARVADERGDGLAAERRRPDAVVAGSREELVDQRGVGRRLAGAQRRRDERGTPSSRRAR